MRDPTVESRAVIAFSAAVALCLSGCTSTRMLDEPEHLVVEKPIVSVTRDDVTAQLDWVIVRGGPGSWVAQANWDEYLLRIHNLSDRTILVRDIAVYDSLGVRVATSARPKRLADLSKDTIKRHKDAGLSVSPGANGGLLLTAGGVALVGYTAVEYAMLGGSAGALGAAGAATAALFLAPVLIATGMAEAEKADDIAREMARRYTALPEDLAPGETVRLDLFFPIVPSPVRIEVTIVDDAKASTLSINAKPHLAGLHVDAERENE